MGVKPYKEINRREFLDKAIRIGLGATAYNIASKTPFTYAQSSPASGTIDFWRPDGSPWFVVPEGFSESASSIRYSMNGSGLYPLTIRGNGALETGYITIRQDNRPDKNIILSHAAIGAGYASSIVLLDSPNGAVANLGFLRNGYGVSVEGSEPSTNFKIPFLYNAMWNTGVALHNPSYSKANLEILGMPLEGSAKESQWCLSPESSAQNS